MNRIVFAMALTVLCSFASAQKVGEKVYREIHINGATVSKWLELSSIADYDSLGNKIHIKLALKDEDSKRVKQVEWWFEYDNKGNVALSRNNNGLIWMYSSDKEGHRYYGVSTTGEENWFEHDDKGNEIHRKTSNGDEDWLEYDGKGNVIHKKSTLAKSALTIETWHRYDSSGNHVYEKRHNSGGGSESIWEEWHEYNDRGKIAHTKSKTRFPGTEMNFSNEDWYEYDPAGKWACARSSDGSVVWTEYTFWSNGKIKTETRYQSL